MTARAWFRQMRAADFERDLYPDLAFNGVGGVDVWSCGVTARCDGRIPWTLFDVRRLVDRVTAEARP